MKSSLKVLLSLLILGFIFVGFYFGGVNAIGNYIKMEKLTLKKQISVKPDNIREKQILVKSNLIDKEEFTFFDTLDDPSMSKFVGINESVFESKEIANDKTPYFESTVKRHSTSHAVGMDVKKALNIVAPKINIEKQHGPLDSGFSLQVGSFHKVAGANLLKNNLGNKGYPVFVAEARIPEMGEPLYRVFVGSFAKKRAAEETAISLKEIENLDSVKNW